MPDSSSQDGINYSELDLDFSICSPESTPESVSTFQYEIDLEKNKFQIFIKSWVVFNECSGNLICLVVWAAAGGREGTFLGPGGLITLSNVKSHRNNLYIWSGKYIAPCYPKLPVFM